MAGRVIASEELARTHLAPDLIRSGNFSPGMKAGPFVFVSGSAASDRASAARCCSPPESSKGIRLAMLVSPTISRKSFADFATCRERFAP